MLKTLLTLALASTTAADYGGDNQYDWQTYGSEGYKAETSEFETSTNAELWPLYLTDRAALAL